MSEIDWSKAPEGATAICVDDETFALFYVDKDMHVWDDGGGYWFEYKTDFPPIATRPTRKTVEDAVRAVLTGFDGESLYYSPSRNTWYCSSTPIPEDAYKVCTRAEFDECVRGKGEWTHITNSGQECKIHVSEPDVNGIIIVLNSSGEYMRHSAEALQPIKPTITKAEAEKQLGCRIKD